jgi:hypothetical protein
MPIKRKQGESKEEFVSRCIPIEVNAGKSKEQAAAICYSYYEEKQLMAVKNIRRNKLKANVPHYTEDGELWTGPTHKHNGRLMTGLTHTEDSEYLYHEEELKTLRFESYKFEKQRVFVNSSNVDRMMWNSDTKLLTISFHDGSVYDYENVERELFLDVAEGNSTCVTNGSNEFGSWTIGKNPSVGAAVHEYLSDRGKKTTKANPFR